jgi:hypothetical protein
VNEPTIQRNGRKLESEKMARRKRSRKKSFTIPLAPIAGLMAGLRQPITEVMAGRYNRAIDWLSWSYTGYDIPTKTWKPERMMTGLMPLIIGGLVHKYVGGSLGINRALGRAGVPLIRI